MIFFFLKCLQDLKSVVLPLTLNRIICLKEKKKEQTNYMCVLNVVQQENNLHKSDWRERFFDWIKVRDPFEPVVPEHLEIDNFFTAPFDYDRRDK